MLKNVRIWNIMEISYCVWRNRLLWQKRKMQSKEACIIIILLGRYIMSHKKSIFQSKERMKDLRIFWDSLSLRKMKKLIKKEEVSDQDITEMLSQIGN